MADERSGDTVAFIGLGAMGAPMAANLLRAGFVVRGYNRSPARSAPLVALGAQGCGSVGEAVRGAACVVSMVADDAATREVMLGAEGVLAAAAPGTLVVDSSTNSPGMAREAAAAAAARGVAYLDAPVSGSTGQAANRELVFMVGGDADAYARARPLFEAMGRMHRHVGPSGAGAALKLVNNMLSGALGAALAEAVRVVEAAGLDPAVAQEVLAEGAAGSRLVRSKIPKMLARDFSPQFQLGLMDKDVRYFLELAQSLDVPVPVASIVRAQLQAARRAGLGELDSAALFLHVGGEAAAARDSGSR